MNKSDQHTEAIANPGCRYERTPQTGDYTCFEELCQTINWAVVEYIIWRYLRGYEGAENILQDLKIILQQSWLRGKIPTLPAAYDLMKKTAECRAIQLIRFKSKHPICAMDDVDGETDPRIWVPWTPWIRSEFGVRMMRIEDYGLQERGLVLPQQWAEKKALLQITNSGDESALFPILQSVFSNPCVAERRFAPRGGSVFSSEDLLTIQCRDLPIPDTRFSLVLDTKGGRRTLISGDDPAWRERCAVEPEKNRRIRRIWMQKRAAEWLELLGCEMPVLDSAVEVRFTFVAENNSGWESGAVFRIAGESWFDKAEQEIEQKLLLWQADQEGAYSSVTDHFQQALAAAQFGENTVAHLVMSLTAPTHGALLTQIRRTLLYYCMKMDHQGVKFASKMLSQHHSAGILIRVLNLLCTERGGTVRPPSLPINRERLRKNASP